MREKLQHLKKKKKKVSYEAFFSQLLAFLSQKFNHKNIYYATKSLIELLVALLQETIPPAIRSVSRPLAHF